MNTDVYYAEEEDKRVCSSKETFFNEPFYVLDTPLQVHPNIHDVSLHGNAVSVSSIDDILVVDRRVLLSPKGLELLNWLLEYRNMETLRCIVFVQKVVRAMLLSMEKLGLRCAYESPLCLLEKMTTDVYYEEEEDKRVCSSKETFLNEALDVLGASSQGHPNVHDVFLHGKALPINTIDNISVADRKVLLSPKGLESLNWLLKYRNTETLCCIVFVQKVVTAMVLARILSRLSLLSFVRCGFLSGTTVSLVVMGKEKQQSTLAEFYSGKLIVWIATDVAEEGLDIRKCSSVIRFDLSKLVRSIQSLKCARVSGSHCIIFLEQDSGKQHEQFQNSKKSEESTREQAFNGTCDSLSKRKLQPEDIEVFQVETTGATVSIDLSISLISHFCSKLPGDKLYRPKPVFLVEKVEDDDGKYFRKLNLPPNGPFWELTDPVRRILILAKQSVCLEACRQSHALGQLKDHLNPVINVENVKKPEEEEVMNLSGKNVSGAGTNKRKELHGTASTNALCADWITKAEGISLHAYLICFDFCQKQEDDYVDFVLLLKATLDNDIANTEFPIYLSNKRKAIVKFIDGGEYFLKANQLEYAKAYHELIFNGMFGYFGNRVNKKERMSVIKNMLLSDQVQNLERETWDSLQAYLVLPLYPGKLADEMEEIPINWTAVREAAITRTKLKLFSVQRITDVHQCALERKPILSKGSVQMASGSKLASELVGTLVVAIHTGRIYSVMDVLDELNANCPMERAEESTTYSKYFAKRYKKVLEYPEQPLLRVEQSHGIHNLLTPDVADAEKKQNTEKAKLSIFVELPAELCLCTGLSSDVMRSLYLFPSVFHRFSALLLAAQLRRTIARDMPQCNSIQGTVVMQALTTLRCSEGFSFESLELLGDSFLKYAVSRYLYLVYDKEHEGQLSNRRSHLICNKTLHHLAVERHLPGYIRDEPFQPELWKAPGMPSVKSVRCKCNLENLTVLDGNCNKGAQRAASVFCIGETCSKGHRWMYPKTISDAVEALVGAFLSSGEFGPALGFLNWIGMDIDFDLSLYEGARNPKVNLEVLNAVNIAGIESQLSYVFINKALLVEALTHGSKEDRHDGQDGLGGGCYQRLEFLGDAVLDFLITRHLFSTHPGLSPGVLSDLRSAALNNECFARSAVKHNLQRYLRHGSGDLLNQITEFVNAVEATNEQGLEQLFGWEGAHGPKVLGDLVESIAGAILVDSGFDVDRVWSVMVRILSPLVTPSTLPFHPIREVLELSQSKGLSFVWKKMPSIGKESTVTAQIEIGDEVISKTAKGRLKKTARKNAAQKILSALKERGILHPRKEMANESDCTPFQISHASETCMFDRGIGGSEEKLRRVFVEEDLKDSDLSCREAQALGTPALKEPLPVLSINNSSMNVVPKNSPGDQTSSIEADMAPMQNAMELADELETSINLKLSPTGSRSKSETASGCCDNSAYMAKPMIQATMRTSYSNSIIKSPEGINILQPQRRSLGMDGPAKLAINIMGKGFGRARLNEYHLKKKWPVPNYTLVEQRGVYVEKFIFKVEVKARLRLLMGTSVQERIKPRTMQVLKF